jgi:hypothetical protein
METVENAKSAFTTVPTAPTTTKHNMMDESMIFIIFLLDILQIKR